MRKDLRTEKKKTDGNKLNESQRKILILRSIKNRKKKAHGNGRKIDFIRQYSMGMHCLYHLIAVLTFECTMTQGFSNLRCFGWNLK